MPSKFSLLRQLEKERTLVQSLQDRLAYLESENENLRIPQVAWEEGVFSRVEKSGEHLTDKISRLQKLTASPSFNNHPLPMLPPMNTDMPLHDRQLSWTLTNTMHPNRPIAVGADGSIANLSTTAGEQSREDDDELSDNILKQPYYTKRSLSDEQRAAAERAEEHARNEARFFAFEWGTKSTSSFVRDLLASTCVDPFKRRKNRNFTA